MSTATLTLSAAKLEASGVAELRASRTALHADQPRMEQRAMAFKTKARTVRGTDAPITAGSIRAEYREAFTPAVCGDPRSAKELARVAEITARQIENIRQGLSGGSVPTFFALARAIPELRAMALRWLEADQNCDPDAERLNHDLQVAVSAFLRRKEAA